MRLLNIETGQLDVTFRDVIDNKGIGGRTLKQKLGHEKLEYLCKQAHEDGLTHVWADVCCIDQTNLTELTEAINSMYSWYASSKVCYVYLADVLDRKVPSGRDYASQESEQYLRSSRWFRRGWTLQELIAPKNVIFYDKHWTMIGRLDGTMPEFLRMISGITSIDVDILSRQKQLSSVSIAARMSWASGRGTTRPEDIAYSLLGIFDVSMGLVYGEGDKAFYRLQQEIIKKSVDHSIFAWQAYRYTNKTLLATSPEAFRGAHDIICAPALRMEQSYTLTNAGLEITLPVVSYADGQLCVLNCRKRGVPPCFFGLRLRRYGQDVHSKVHFIPMGSKLIRLDLGKRWGEPILYAKQQHITILEDGEHGPNHDKPTLQSALTVLCTYDGSRFALVDSFPQLHLPTKSLTHFELPTARGLYGIFVLRSSDLPSDALLLAFFLISTQNCFMSRGDMQTDEFTALPVLIPVHGSVLESTTLEEMRDYLCHSYRDLRTTLFGVAPLAPRAAEARVSMKNGPTFYARASFPQKSGEYFMHLEIGRHAQPGSPAPPIPVDYLYWVECEPQQGRYVTEPIVANKDTHEFHRAAHMAYVANHVSSGDVKKKGDRYTHTFEGSCTCAGLLLDIRGND